MKHMEVLQTHSSLAIILGGFSLVCVFVGFSVSIPFIFENI